MVAAWRLRLAFDAADDVMQAVHGFLRMKNSRCKFVRETGEPVPRYRRSRVNDANMTIGR